MFRLEPKAYIGDSDWTANAKIEYTMYPEVDSNAELEVENNIIAVSPKAT